ncbi:response regulator [Legionella cincinnatiensis]|uniref:Sigma 54-dependent response regulator n=1 Tax=Legionella cincinnatiensis TaxID=28085 RepID=A0A378IQ31_9GAMM|nr:response regulator [Legionella cincinnatiensis]KTC93418.1 sigma 54-dependent response regulator [Legionella cincinnatiensis]STX36581.1 sigma 54-dependent response regulator [Legionella cincinnatiensis]
MLLEKNEKFILLIEDNNSVREALVWALEYAGYLVVTVRNGEEALSFLEKNPLPFVIFLDLMMPVLDGFEFREKKRANQQIKNIPTIIASAKTNLEKVEGMQYESFLSKPFELNDLLGLIRKYHELN